MAHELDNIRSLNELALFAGAGGGILGGHLLGWRTVCAVEWNPYAASVLVARQNDGILPPFPIWDDVQTFNGKPWRGLVDVVSGGFPCQDISCAGKGAGITGERSGMWAHMARIIGEVRPRYAFIENSPMLTTRGLDTVLCDLAAMGYDAEWGVISAADCGALHKRDRIWILAYTSSTGREYDKHIGNITGRTVCGSTGEPSKNGGKQYLGNALREGLERAHDNEESPERVHSIAIKSSYMGNTSSIGQQGQRESIVACNSEAQGERQADNVKPVCINREWPTEPDVGRVANGVAARVDRLTAIGNGQVSRVAATAFATLAHRYFS